MLEAANILLVGKQMDVIGGIQAVNRSLQRGLLANGINCDIFSFRESSEKKRHGRILGLLFDLSRFWRLAQERERTFVFNVSGMEIILFSIICLMWRRPFFYWLHGSPQVFQQNSSAKFLIRYLFRRARAVVVLHASFLDYFKNSFARIVVIPNVVDQLRLDVKSEDAKLSKVIWVGRYSDEKNPELALNAMYELARRFPAVQFLFISPGSANHESIQKSVPSNFRFVDGANFAPNRFFDGASLHLLTSKLEAMPGVLFESTSCHARFVSTRCSPWVDNLVALGHGISVSTDIGASELVEKVSEILAGELLDFHTERIGAFLAGYNEKSVVAMWQEILEVR
jgi:glycosyltransferase involved in cell wall biosynthesis